MTRQRLPLVLAKGSIALLAACDTATSPSGEESLAREVRTPFFSVQQEQSIRTLAQSLARGFDDDAARTTLYGALQASLLVEHKVTLHELFGDESGNPIVAAIARSGEMSPTRVRSMIRALPPLDVYIPHVEHRDNWQPSRSIAVAALLDLQGVITAYVGNEAFTIDRRSNTPTATAVLLLAPVEPKATRPEFVAASEPFLPECPPDCDDGGPGGGPFLSIDTLITYNVCDNNFCWETNEFKFQATDSNGEVDATWTCSGVEQYDVVRVQIECPSSRVHDSAPSEVAYVDAHLIETDGWPNPDDDWVDYLTPPPNYVWHPARVVDNSGDRKQFVLYLYPDGANFFSFFCPTCPPPIETVSVVFRW